MRQNSHTSTAQKSVLATTHEVFVSYDASAILSLIIGSRVILFLSQQLLIRIILSRIDLVLSPEIITIIVIVIIIIVVIITECFI